MQKQEIFPEIFQRSLTSLDLPGLPPINDSGFEQAVIMHYAMQYAAKGWTAAVVVSDGMVRVVAVPQQGIEPKAYLMGLLHHGYIEDALPGLEAMYGMFDDPDICSDVTQLPAIVEVGRKQSAMR